PPTPAPTTRTRSDAVDGSFGTGTGFAERPQPDMLRIRLAIRAISTPSGPGLYSERCSRTWPLSAETTCTAAIWSIGVEMLPAGVAVWPGSATQVASRVSLPSRPTTTIARVSWWAFSGARQTHRRLMDVPQCWPDSCTVEVSRLVPICAIGCEDAVICWAGVEVNP